MPNRIIKESICDDEKIASLKDFEFRLWVGLITQADDAGRGDARPAIIKGRVFPLREQVTVKGITDGLSALATIGLIALYEVDGRLYYVLPNWSKHQRIRDCKPKYPAPEDAENLQSAAICGNLPQAAASCGELRRAAASCGYNPIQSESNPNTNPNTKSTPAPRENHGVYGWVQLTADEYARLVADFGEGEAERCIAYVDESAQSSGNKNKWKDWNLVVRRCHRDGWGLSAKRPVDKATAQNAQYCQHDASLSPLEKKAVERALANEAYDERP